jgi:hypothetical protein
MIAFANVGNSASSGIAYPTAGTPSAVKAMLPQTFLDVVTKQPEGLGEHRTLYCKPVKTGTEHDQSL